MADLFTDDDVTAAARAVHDTGVSVPEDFIVARSVLAAVAPVIAARALREAADSESGWCECDTCFSSRVWLRARANAIEGGSHE